MTGSTASLKRLENMLTVQYIYVYPIRLIIVINARNLSWRLDQRVCLEHWDDLCITACGVMLTKAAAVCVCAHAQFRRQD